MCVLVIATQVAAVSGDARRALDICRRAVELAGTSAVCVWGAGGLAHTAQVDIKMLSSALQEMTSSPVVLAVRNASLQERLLLQSVRLILSCSSLLM